MARYDVESRVPTRGIPTPEWISKSAFEKQLVHVHGEVPDPRVGLYGPRSMMWRISRHSLVGGLGAGRALLLQIAHPWVTQGIDQHSMTRNDPLGRAHRTFTAVLSMTFGSLDQAFEAARVVHVRHASIHGRMDYDAGGFSSGSRYQANEANAMVWVHATLWETLMNCYELVVEDVSLEDKERYYQETKLFAYLFGIPDEALPPDWSTFVEYTRRVAESEMLAVTPATRRLARFLFSPPHPVAKPATEFLRLSTAATLPERLRREFGFTYGARERAEFAALVATFRGLDRTLPRSLRYSPTYFEALARIAGRKPKAMTRAMTRATLGQWALVA